MQRSGCFLMLQPSEKNFHQLVGLEVLGEHLSHFSSPSPETQSKASNGWLGQAQIYQLVNQVPLEHTPNPQPPFYEGYRFRFVFWGTLRYVTWVCWDFLRLCFWGGGDDMQQWTPWSCYQLNMFFLLNSEAGNFGYQVIQSDLFIPYLEVT